MWAWYLSPLTICAPASLEVVRTRIGCSVLLIFWRFSLFFSFSWTCRSFVARGERWLCSRSLESARISLLRVILLDSNNGVFFISFGDFLNARSAFFYFRLRSIFCVPGVLRNRGPLFPKRIHPIPFPGSEDGAEEDA